MVVVTTVGVATTAAGARPGQPAVQATHDSIPGRTQVPVTVAPANVDLTPSAAMRPLPVAATHPPMDVLETDVSRLRGPAVIHLASGEYGRLVDMSARRQWITISGRGDRRPPVLDGADLWGAQDIRFVDVDFRSIVTVDHSPIYHAAQPAHNIQVLDSDIDCGTTSTSRRAEGLGVRGGSSDIEFEGDWVHDCYVGFGSIPTDPLSTHVSIEHCLFSNMSGDGLVLGAMKDLLVKDDVIRDVIDPAGVVHNDAIAFFGNTDDVQIDDDVLADSRVMLIFATPAFAGTTTHTASNRDVFVENDILYGAGSVAIMDEEIVGAHFVNDTMWHNHYGSLWLINTTHKRLMPYTLVENDVMQGYLLYNLAPTTERDNIIVDPDRTYAFGSHDLIGDAPRFVDAGAGDFSLVTGSPGFASDVATSRRAMSPSADMFGRPFGRRRSVGAVQPGDPSVAWGRPWTASAWFPHSVRGGSRSRAPGPRRPPRSSSPRG